MVYTRIDGIKVTPQAGMARAGGAVFPKQLQQFEAIAVANGPDGKPDTPDDLQLGAVPVTWSLEEFTATFDDDDLKFVGTLDQTGLFTPNVDGPNPARSGERNNIGDVWVVADYTGDGRDKPLRARAHLLVTVPVYMRWYSAEAMQ
jgi:quinohemoprotein amine dehydrogenase